MKFFVEHADALFSGLGLALISAIWKSIRAVKNPAMRRISTSLAVISVSGFALWLLRALGVPQPLGFLSSVSSAIVDFLASDSDAPMWLVLCLASIAGLLVFGAGVLVVMLFRRDHRQYVTDQFLGLRWRWNWGPTTGALVSLAPYCPDDDTALVLDPTSHRLRPQFSCDTCGTRFGPFDGPIDSLHERIERQIDRKVRNGLWS